MSDFQKVVPEGERYDYEYEELLSQVLTDGQIKGDRTGTGTVSLFGTRMQFWLPAGFPLITTKKVWFKGVVEELLWILSGSTSNRDLERKNVGIWKEWQDQTGDLGPIYGCQWRRWQGAGQTVDLVEVRKPADDGEPEGVVTRFAPAADEDIKVRGRSTGRIVHTNKCGDLRLLGVNADGSYQGQFLETGTVVTVGRPAATHIDDPFRPTLAGVGYIGSPSGPYTQSALNLWRGIIKRCYLPSSPAYAVYGARGVTVSKRWHCFSNFLADLPTIPGYESWRATGGLYHLDKDYYGSNQYGPSTSVFLPAFDNVSMTGDVVEFNGEKYISLRECERSTGVSRKKVLSLGGTLLTPPPGFNYRRVRYFDQISWVINEIKTNPNSRRLVVSSWNVADLPQMALSPCHALFQFDVSDGHLNCQLYQRSADMFLGVPFNIASYSLLTCMIAQQCDLKPGMFTWVGGDTHVYLNHQEQVRLQLSRNGFDLPGLELRRRDSIFDYTADDIRLVNYEAHPTIAAPVAV